MKPTLGLGLSALLSFASFASFASLAACMHTPPPLDPENTGGAMLLGLKGVCIISHGSSSARRIISMSSIRKTSIWHETPWWIE